MFQRHEFPLVPYLRDDNFRIYVAFVTKLFLAHFAALYRNANICGQPTGFER